MINERIQVKDSIPWVRCASGIVITLTHPGAFQPHYLQALYSSHAFSTPPSPLKIPHLPKKPFHEPSLAVNFIRNSHLFAAERVIRKSLPLYKSCPNIFVTNERIRMTPGWRRRHTRHLRQRPLPPSPTTRSRRSMAPSHSPPDPTLPPSSCPEPGGGFYSADAGGILV